MEEAGPSSGPARPKLNFYPDFASRAGAVFGGLFATSLTQQPAAETQPQQQPWSVSHHVIPFQRGGGMGGPRQLMGEDEEDEYEHGERMSSDDEEDDARPDPLIDQAEIPDPDAEEDEEEDGEGFGRRRPRPGRKSMTEFGERAQMSKRYARAVDNEDEEDEYDRIAEAREPGCFLSNEGVYRGVTDRPARDTEVPLEGNYYERHCRDIEGRALEDIDDGVRESGLDVTEHVNRSHFHLRSGVVVDLGIGEEGGAPVPWAGQRDDPLHPPSTSTAARANAIAALKRTPSMKSAMKTTAATAAEGEAGPSGAQARGEVKRQKSVRFSGAEGGGEGETPMRKGRAQPPRRRGGPIGLSVVPDHVKNPSKYTVYELDEPVEVGNGYRGFGVRTSSSTLAEAQRTHHTHREDDNRRAVQEATQAAVAAATTAHMEDDAMDLPPLEPGAGTIQFRAKARGSGAQKHGLDEREGDAGAKHRKLQGGFAPSLQQDEEEEGDGEGPGVAVGVPVPAHAHQQTQGFRQRSGHQRAGVMRKKIEDDHDHAANIMDTDDA